jgi:predicted transcriptional regulator
MSRNPLLEVRKDEYLSLVARELLISEGQNLEETITLISKKLNISKEKVEQFVEYLYRSNLLLKTKERFGLTLQGVQFLLSLVQDVYFNKNLEGGIHERGRG